MQPTMTCAKHIPYLSKRPRTHERVIQVLLKRIFRGGITVGDKLATERTLARESQVNRATVREALRYLENLELIAIRQGDGAYVRNFLESGNQEIAKALMQVDETMRREVWSALLEVRRNNMPAVAYAAALKRTPGHLQQLEKVALHRPDLTVMLVYGTIFWALLAGSGDHEAIHRHRPLRCRRDRRRHQRCGRGVRSRHPRPTGGAL